MITLSLALTATLAYAGVESVGPNGIDATGLLLPDGSPLTGVGGLIGQVEPGRPGLEGFDDAGNFNTSTAPEAVFLFDHAAIANIDLDKFQMPFFHAEEVAGVMISSAAVAPGVAPGASLYASAFRDGLDGTYPSVATGILLATQHVADQNIGQVLAINHSYQVKNTLANGNSQLTLGIDWIAETRNVLNVTANPNQPSGMPPTFPRAPSDNYNGITVASSQKKDGVYRMVSSSSYFGSDAEGLRTSIDLIAPGEDVEVIGFTDNVTVSEGTSIATPHVTGTVALLQEYGNAKALIDPVGKWTYLDRHEVMKAVLMNSADKIKDDGTTQVNGSTVPPGGFLGMARTVVDTAGNNWLQSEAMVNDFQPLDDEMGAGHLNARRAIQQLDPGEFGPNGDPVPVIGWSYATTMGTEPTDIHKFGFDEPLMGKSFISITVAWDRVPQFEDDNGNAGTFTSGATFQQNEFPEDAYKRMDLYLLPKGATDTSEAIARSLSSESNLDHLFFQIPETGEYEFWISQFDNPFQTQKYAVAWWAAGVPQQVPGDFDLDGDVDGQDFLAWQRNPSVGDLTDWQTNYGVSSVAAARTIPEPTCMVLACCLVFVAGGGRR